MKKLLFIVAVLVIPNVTLAKESEVDCIKTIYKIVQHETGSTNSSEIYRFMTEQILHDLNYIPCSELTSWRWKIGYYPEYKVTNKVKLSVLKVLFRWPDVKEFPRCGFIGSPNDIKVWKKFGYNTKIGYTKTVGNLTVIGVDCHINKGR